MRSIAAIFLGLALGLAAMAVEGVAEAKDDSGSAAAEKEKAEKNPYANDLGPAELSKKELSGYSENIRKGYDLLVKKCGACHSPSRPLNSQFLELSEKEIAKIKKESPEMLKAPLIWQIETSIWRRYVKRMMRKPGCDIKSKEGKAIWAFLASDSKERKSGKNWKKWKSHRQKLLDEFKQKHPKRYKILYEESTE